MKSIFSVSLIFATNVFLLSTAHAKFEREIIVGYLKGNARNEFYFVKNPSTLEPGIRIIFASDDDLQLSCKVTQVQPVPDCPIQTFSYVPGISNDRPALLEARLESADTEWHLRQSKAKLLK